MKDGWWRHDVSTVMESASPVTVHGVVLVKAEFSLSLSSFTGVSWSLHSLYSSLLLLESFFSVHCSYSATAL